LRIQNRAKGRGIESGFVVSLIPGGRLLLIIQSAGIGRNVIGTSKRRAKPLITFRSQETRCFFPLEDPKGFQNL
jgi:hypothetical protein